METDRRSIARNWVLAQEKRKLEQDEQNGQTQRALGNGGEIAGHEHDQGPVTARGRHGAAYAVDAIGYFAADRVCSPIQSAITAIALGSRVCSICAYSDGAPVVHFWNR